MASIFINSERVLDTKFNNSKNSSDDTNVISFGNRNESLLEKEEHRQVECVTIDKNKQLEVVVHQRTDGSIIIKGKNTSSLAIQSSIIIKNCTTECYKEIVGEHMKVSSLSGGIAQESTLNMKAKAFCYTGMIKEGYLNFNFPPRTYTVAVIRDIDK